MASIFNLAGVGLSSPAAAPRRSRGGGFAGAVERARTRRVVSVRAEVQAINPEIRKSEDKVVDSVVVSELSKPLTAYCRILFGNGDKAYSGGAFGTWEWNVGWMDGNGCEDGQHY